MTSLRHARRMRRAPLQQRGAALVVGLLLLLVLTILAISGMTTATLELQMAGNEQYQERSFQAADAGIERAIAAGEFSTAVPIGTWDTSGDDPVPVRGTGEDGCTQTVPSGGGTPTNSDDCYEYFVRFDDEAGVTSIPGGGYSLGTGFEAYHFEIQSFGTSGRGAESDHVQSIYVVGPGGP
jgi:type IV pilus assembly protein PilX